jgi:spermidine/putrescine transport system permease protein
MGSATGSRVMKVYSWLIYFYLYVPILILVVFSFNTSRLNAVWKGFTLQWYVKLFNDGPLLQAAKNSLIIAVVSTLAATIIGTLTAFAVHRHRFPGKRVLEAVIYVPIIIPEIVMGISLLAFFAAVRIPLGLTTIIIAHIAFNISFVAVVVRSRLYGFDHTLEEAAADLGANEWNTFRRVTFPLVFPGILAGALLAFTLSLDDFVITFFTAGPGSTTLPLRIYSMVKFGVSPEVNALSTFILTLTLTLLVISQRMQRV